MTKKLFDLVSINNMHIYLPKSGVVSAAFLTFLSKFGVLNGEFEGIRGLQLIAITSKQV